MATSTGHQQIITMKTNKTSKVQCGKAHSGNKTLVRVNRGFAECIGCGQCYTMDQVSSAKSGDLAGRGLPYIAG